MTTYRGDGGGYLTVDGQELEVRPSGMRATPVRLGVRSVTGVVVKPPGRFTDGRLSVQYLCDDGRTRTTDAVRYDSGTAGDPIIVAAGWLQTVAAHNATHGPVATPVPGGTAAVMAIVLEVWQEQHDELTAKLALARSGGVAGFDCPFVLKPGERVFLVLEDVALIEPRRAPGRYRGGSQGVSIRVAKGLSYRVGGMRGTYVPGPETPQPIDTGTALISNRRVAFAGVKATREWSFPKLLGYTHDPTGWTAIQVSNRQKTSGIAYGAALIEEFDFRLRLALATHNGTTDQIIGELSDQLAELQANHPAPAITAD